MRGLLRVCPKRIGCDGMRPEYGSKARRDMETEPGRKASSRSFRSWCIQYRQVDQFRLCNMPEAADVSMWAEGRATGRLQGRLEKKVIKKREQAGLYSPLRKRHAPGQEGLPLDPRR